MEVRRIKLESGASFEIGKAFGAPHIRYPLTVIRLTDNRREEGGRVAEGAPYPLSLIPFAVL